MIHGCQVAIVVPKSFRGRFWGQFNSACWIKMTANRNNIMHVVLGDMGLLVQVHLEAQKL